MKGDARTPPFDSHRRVHTEEILDAGTAGDEEVLRSLRDIERINKFLGGRRLLLNLLSEQLQRTGLRSFSLLDVGTGAGDLLSAVARWCRRQGYPAELVGLDRQLRHLRFADNHDWIPVSLVEAGLSRHADGGIKPPLQKPNWLPVCGEAGSLPFLSRTFDFVSASLFLHHFEDKQAVALLRALAQTARHALLVNDLERHVLAYHFIRLTPFFASSPITRWDGPVSVERAFHKEELEELARQSGLKRWRVRKHLPFRLSLVVEVS